MSQISAKARASFTCAVVVVAIAACGAPEPGTAAPDGGTDLLDALPAPISAPAAPTTTTAATTAPSTTAPTSSARPTTTTRQRPPTSTAAPTAKALKKKKEKAATTAGTAPAPRSSAAKPPPAPAKLGPQWRPVGGDEFNGAALDTGTWAPYNSKGGFGNGLRRPEAITQSDGTLKITAKDDVSGGMAHSSGQLYGRWEFRARTEPGRGLGSAILLWPDSEQWPRDGEVDIMEVPGENRDLAHFVLHWGEANNVHGTDIAGNFAQWHTFAVEWLPDRITWFVDGVQRYENTDKAAIPTTPMHLTIQLDQGPKKNWIPAPDETTPDTVTLEVDWVRIHAAQ